MIKGALTILSVPLKLTSFSGLRIQLFMYVIDMICIRVLVLEYDADMYQNSWVHQFTGNQIKFAAKSL